MNKAEAYLSRLLDARRTKDRSAEWSARRWLKDHGIEVWVSRGVDAKVLRVRVAAWERWDGSFVATCRIP